MSAHPRSSTRPPGSTRRSGAISSSLRGSRRMMWASGCHGGAARSSPRDCSRYRDASGVVGQALALTELGLQTMRAREEEMRRFWDARAREDAFFFVDSRQPYRSPDPDRFWTGEEAVDHLLGRLGV